MSPTSRLAKAAILACGLLACGLLASALGAWTSGAATDRSRAQDPAAIIEAIDAASVTELGFMDFVYEGMELQLGESGSITLSYLRSCRVERITGGLVRIGQSKSEVSSPTPMEVVEVDCDGGGIVPTDRQGEDAAGVAFRGTAGSSEVPIRVYSTVPVFAFSEPVGELVIERDDPGKRESFKFPVDGTRLDLADHRVTLEAGGSYRASSGARSVLFRVSRTATGSGRTIIERLIGF